MGDQFVTRLFWLAAVLAALAMVLAVTSCATRLEYQPVPAWLVPSRPTLPAVSAAELACLSDETYARLATRDRLRAQHEAELRALIGGN